MKKLLFMASIVGAIVATGSVFQGGPPRGQKWPDIKIVLRQGEHKEWRIQEDSALFVARFATVNQIYDMLNEAETRELAKTVAVAIANHLGSTNDVRIVHFETPVPASTNLVDRFQSLLNGADVTDEVIPLH